MKSKNKRGLEGPSNPLITFVLMKKILTVSLLLLFFIIPTACTIKLQPDVGTSGVYAFVPPSAAAPSNTPIPTINTTLLAPATQEIVCQDNLLFLRDISIPDGTEIASGATLDKQWEVQNNGTCNWEDGYTIRFIGGSDMGAETIQDLIPARSGAIVTVRISFITPSEPGNYRSAWQAYNKNDIPFGDPIYIDINVTE